MIQSFSDQGTQDIYEGDDTKRARRTCPHSLWPIARRKLDQLDVAELLEDLKVPPGNHLESLKADRRGQHSIRINQQYRICFRWSDAGPENVEIADYH